MFLNIRKERCALESRAERFLEMAALIISGGAPKGISPAPPLRSALPFQEITLAFVPFKTQFSISAYDSCGSVAITRRRASG